MKNKVTLFNQVTGPLFIDIVNAFSKEYDKVTLVTGAVQSTYSPVNENVEIKFFARYNKRSHNETCYMVLVLFTSSNLCS